MEEDSLRPVWTGLTALSGVYIMFLIEHFLTLGKMYKDKKQKVRMMHKHTRCKLSIVLLGSNPPVWKALKMYVFVLCN